MKIGDYVKVKDGIELDNGELSKDWAGEILEIDDEFITIKKDAQTLNSLSDDYIKHGIENGLDEYNYVFEKENLELSERRDTNKMYKMAIEKFQIRYDDLDEEIFIKAAEEMDEDDFMELFGDSEAVQEAYFAGMEILTQNFFRSPFAEKIADINQADANFIIEMFVEYAMNYRDEMLEDWTKYTIDEICLDVIPRKVSTEAETFEIMGKVLKHYFDFLAAERFIKNRTLGNYVYSKRKIIYDKSQNPANWGMAKSMMMGAVNQGFDMDDENALQSFMASQMFKPMELPESYRNYHQEPAKKDALKKIGRNDKVSVKYTDGKVLKEVKFKKVMKDVQSGKCELI